MQKIQYKKYINLVVSALIFIFALLVYIFSDIIFDAGGIYPTLTNIIIVWSSFILLFICLYKIIKRKEMINIVSICILILALIINNTTFNVDYVKDFFDKLEKRTEVVNLIKEGKLVADEYNNIKLPKEYKNVSADGEVSILKNDEDNQMIGFWISRGINTDGKLYIYSSDGKAAIIDKFGEEYCDVGHLYDDTWFYVTTYWYEKDYYK